MRATLFAVIACLFASVGACTGEPATDTASLVDTDIFVDTTVVDPPWVDADPEALETDLDPVGETDPPEETDLDPPDTPGDTAQPWVDTDLPRPPLSAQGFSFAESWRAQLCSAGECLSGGAGGDGEVESWPITCTRAWPGDIGQTVCLAYQRQADGTVGVIRRLDAVNGQWLMPSSGLGDFVSAGLLLPGRLPKIGNLLTVDLDGDGLTEVFIPHGDGAVFKPDPAQPGHFIRHDEVMAARDAAIGGPAGGNGPMTVADVDGNGLLDVIGMKFRCGAYGPCPSGEPTGLIILHQLPSGWEGRLHGEPDGHNDIYEWLVTPAPVPGNPPLIIGAGAPATRTRTQAWEWSGALDPMGLPGYQESSQMGGSLASVSPMGAELVWTNNMFVPSVTVTDASRDQCWTVMEPQGPWWFESRTTHEVVQTSPTPFPGPKCVFDATPETREIPWGQAHVAAGVIATANGHDTTQHQMCGPAARLPGPSDCPPTADPTLSIVTPDLSGGTSARIRSADPGLVVWNGLPLGNYRSLTVFDVDNDGDGDVLMGGAFESGPVILENQTTGPRFCMTLLEANGSPASVTRVELQDSQTGDVSVIWPDGGSPPCFMQGSRQPGRNWAVVTWRNGQTTTMPWGGRNPNVVVQH